MFPADPPVSAKAPDGSIVLWHLRFRNSKEVKNSRIQIFGERRKRNPETGKEETTDRSDQWEDFMQFGPSDVIDNNGKPKTSFDVVGNIKKTNSELGKSIESSLRGNGQKISPDSEQKMSQALAQIVYASVPNPERGARQMNKPITAEPPEQTGSGPGTPEPPPEGPKAKEKMVNPPPEKQARVEKVPPPAAAEPEKTPEPSKISGPASPEKGDEPEEPSSKLKDLVPKKVKATPKKAPKPAPKATPKPAVPDATGAVAPVATAPEKKSAVAPEAPAPVAAPAATFGPDEERVNRVNTKFLIPNKLSPLKNVEQVKKFYSFLGDATPPSREQIQWAHQNATGEKPAATPAAPAAAKAAPEKQRQKMKEGLQLRDFFL